MKVLSSIKFRVGLGVAAAALGAAAFAGPATTASAGSATWRYCGDDGHAHNIQTWDTFCTTADPPAAQMSCPSFFTSSSETIFANGVVNVTCYHGGASVFYQWY